MAGTISEGYLSRGFTLGRSAARELVFDVWGTDDEAEVKTLLAGAVPGAYLGLALEEVTAEPVQIDDGDGIWKCRARYVRVDGNNEYTFDTGGGQQKVTQSLETINSYNAPGFVAPDFQGAIGVADDKVEGVDVTTPAFTFSETHYLDDAVVDTAYKLTLFRLTGRTNNGTFKGMARGECLFMGASGSRRGDEKWGITFKFAGSANVTGLTLGPITGIDKKGWEYLWVRYNDAVDPAAFDLIKRPVAAYVERVYEEGDFSTLGIGT